VIVSSLLSLSAIVITSLNNLASLEYTLSSIHSECIHHEITRCKEKVSWSEMCFCNRVGQKLKVQRLKKLIRIHNAQLGELIRDEISPGNEYPFTKEKAEREKVTKLSKVLANSYPLVILVHEPIFPVMYV